MKPCLPSITTSAISRTKHLIAKFCKLRVFWILLLTLGILICSGISVAALGSSGEFGRMGDVTLASFAVMVSPGLWFGRLALVALPYSTNQRRIITLMLRLSIWVLMSPVIILVQLAISMHIALLITGEVFPPFW